MASDAASNLDAIDMGTAALPGRATLEIATVRSLSRRSDWHGLLRAGAHLGIIVWGGIPRLAGHAELVFNDSRDDS